MPDPVKVLVVEHDQQAATDLTRAFRQRGWEVVAASDAVMAQSLIVKARPDAIVLNAQIPGGGGLTTLKRIRSSVHSAITPVIAVTGEAAKQKERLMLAGAQECVRPAAEPAVICAAIEKHLAGSRAAAGPPLESLQGAARMAALAASGLLDSPPEAAFDRVTRLVAKLLDAPKALLSMVDDERQFFKSQIGLNEPWQTARQTPLSHSFCQWVVAGQEEVIVNDATAHPVLKSNLAIRDLGVAAYAGVPVTGAGGMVLGSLCAIDSKPRVWTAEDLSTLRDLSRLAEGCAAESSLSRQSPGGPSVRRYVGIIDDTIKGAIAILRRYAQRLDEQDREVLLQIIEQNSGRLVALHRSRRQE